MALGFGGIEAMGRALADARQAGEPTDAIDLRRIGDANEAEAVQASAVRHLGAAQVGYAVRATTPLCARLLRCDEPPVAPLLREYILADGARFRLPPGVVGVGAGFTFLVGRPFPFSDEERLDADHAAGACVSCHLDIHVLGRRVAHGAPLNPWTAAADFGLDVVHVLGPGVRGWLPADLAEAEGVLTLDGHVVARGRGGAIPSGPLAPLVRLAGDVARRGPCLNVGDLVSTGSVIGLIKPIPGQTVRADFGPLGRLTLYVD